MIAGIPTKDQKHTNGTERFLIRHDKMRKFLRESSSSKPRTIEIISNKSHIVDASWVLPDICFKIYIACGFEEDSLENVCILSCFVRLKGILLNLLCFQSEPCLRQWPTEVALIVEYRRGPVQQTRRRLLALEFRVFAGIDKFLSVERSRPKRFYSLYSFTYAFSVAVCVPEYSVRLPADWV